MPTVHRVIAAAVLLAFVAPGARADTAAYWRFEEGSPGAEFVPPATNGGPGSGLALDSSGNGNALRTFADFTNPVYRPDVPFNPVPRTGAPNALSLQFTPNEDLYSEGAPINNRQLNEFTIEASVKFNNLDGWQTFLGKDGFQFANSDPNLSSMYFQLANDDANQDKVAFKFHQGDGSFRDVYTLAPVTAGQWYSFAAVLKNVVPGDTSDQTISLYMRDPATGQYVLQEQEEDLVGGFGLQDRNWTVGRGMYANNPADWVNGFVDEVRISDSALSTSQFLGAVPEPSALGVLAVAGLFALRRRRQRVAHR